ncbi:MAG: hypothetical protein ACLFPD_03765 [Desulfosudaceae bacterium]
MDEIYCLNIREGFSFAVAEASQHWYDLPAAGARTLLEKGGSSPARAGRPSPVTGMAKD